MRYRWHALALVGMAALTAGLWLGGAQAAGAQAVAVAQTTPRTSWGDPDLEGIWRAEATTTPMERPAEFGTREFLTDEELAAMERELAGLDTTPERETEVETRADPRLQDRAPRLARETATARPHEKALLGQEYNAWWTAGPQRERKLWNRTSLIVDPPDGRLPALNPDVLERLEARDDARLGRGEADRPEDRNLGERCISVLLRGVWRSGFSAKRIVQAPGYVVMVYDGLTFARIIPLDGRPAPDDRIRQWLGDARGRWEGDTLVVETTNINDKQDGGPIAPSHNEYLPESRHQHHYFGSGADAHLVERYTRVGPDRIEYERTLTDPSVFTKPFTTIRPLEKADDHMMLENACHEGNYGMLNLLRGNRIHEDQGLIASDAETATRRQQLEELRQRNAELLGAGR